jgi:hypothetical protein
MFNRNGKGAAGGKHILCLRWWGLLPAAHFTGDLTTGHAKQALRG